MIAGLTFVENRVDFSSKVKITHMVNFLGGRRLYFPPTCATETCNFITYIWFSSLSLESWITAGGYGVVGLETHIGTRGNVDENPS